MSKNDNITHVKSVHRKRNGTKMTTREISGAMESFVNTDPFHPSRFLLCYMMLVAAEQKNVDESVIREMVEVEFTLDSINDLQMQDFDRALRFIVSLQNDPVMTLDHPATRH